MTNTETCMREMRHISGIFLQSKDFDEQWILFKAYLNTAHSMSDNDHKTKIDFHNNELMNFVLVLRNILHHQPAKWHFGKHDVQPTSISVEFSQESGARITGSLSLVIQKDTLLNPDLQEALYRKSEKQVKVLQTSLLKIQGHVIVVSNFLSQIQVFIEKYCRENGHYTEAYDCEPTGYNLVKIKKCTAAG